MTSLDAAAYRRLQAWTYAQLSYEETHGQPPPLTDDQRQALLLLAPPPPPPSAIPFSPRPSDPDTDWVSVLMRYDQAASRTKLAPRPEALHEEELTTRASCSSLWRIRYTLPREAPGQLFPSLEDVPMDRDVHEPAFVSKKQAKKYAAWCAVRWLVVHGYISGNMATSAGLSAAALVTLMSTDNGRNTTPCPPSPAASRRSSDQPSPAPKAAAPARSQSPQSPQSPPTQSSQSPQSPRQRPQTTVFSMPTPTPSPPPKTPLNKAKKAERTAAAPSAMPTTAMPMPPLSPSPSPSSTRSKRDTPNIAATFASASASSSATPVPPPQVRSMATWKGKETTREVLGSSSSSDYSSDDDDDDEGSQRKRPGRGMGNIAKALYSEGENDSDAISSEKMLKQVCMRMKLGVPKLVITPSEQGGSGIFNGKILFHKKSGRDGDIEPQFDVPPEVCVVSNVYTQKAAREKLSENYFNFLVNRSTGVW